MCIYIDLRMTSTRLVHNNLLCALLLVWPTKPTNHRGRCVVDQTSQHEHILTSRPNGCSNSA